MNYITVNELKTEYPDADVSKYSDATLSGFITRASASVDDFVEYSFDEETITDELVDGNIDEDRNIVLFPRKIPINNLTSLSIVKGSTSIDINLQDGADTDIFNIPSSKDMVLIPLGKITLNSVSVVDLDSLRTTKFLYKLSYTAGFSSIPGEVKDATGLLVLEKLSKGMNLSGAQSVSEGGISISYSNRKGKSDFVSDAERLLFKYKKVTGF